MRDYTRCFYVHAPDMDLSCLPIVPPTLPGCTCATQGAENVATRKMGKMKRRISLSIDLNITITH